MTNRHYAAFIRSARALASRHALEWDMKCDQEGALSPRTDGVSAKLLAGPIFRDLCCRMSATAKAF